MPSPLRVAVAGVGGFAADHHAALARLEEEGICQVVATCDPSRSNLQQAGERFHFEARRVQLYPDLDTLLYAEKPDVVTLPTPIPLHAEQHRAVVESGAACYLEKPPTLWWPEFESMLSHEATSKNATQIGFNFVGDPFRRAIKRRILNGEFGPLREVSLEAHWPRDRAYYARNNWAGRLRSNGRWVLDSPIGNAIAHYVQNLLFWCGQGSLEAIGAIGEVQASLFRAHPIESYDTAFVGASLAEGPRLRIAATHTTTGSHSERETLTFDQTRIVFDQWKRARIEYPDGRTETCESPIADQGELLRHNLRTYLAYGSGDRSRPITTLEDSRSFVALCDLALISSQAITDFAPSRVTQNEGQVAVEGIAQQMAAFATHGRWPTAVPRAVIPHDLTRLETCARSLLR